LKRVNIDIVSDVMCPWCYIGKRRLEQAIGKLKDIEVDIRWRPYQLDPTLPAQGKDRREYLEQKFGGPERAAQIYQQIETAGKAENLSFNFGAIEISPNTLDAHRIIRWAASEEGDVQDRLVERLFEMFFTQGTDIGKHEALIRAAQEVGMKLEIVSDLLATDKDKREVSEEIAVAQRMGVQGVPCFIINNKYALMGAQEADQLAAAITQAANEAD